MFKLSSHKKVETAPAQARGALPSAQQRTHARARCPAMRENCAHNQVLSEQARLRSVEGETGGESPE